MARLVGTFPGAVDQKGRVIVPAQLRGALGSTIILTAGQAPCILGFPEHRWAKLEEAIAELPHFDEEAAWVRRVFAGQAEERTLDSQGRVLVGERLRAHAGIAQEIVTIGLFDKIEIWDPARYEAACTGKVTDEWLRRVGDGIKL